MRTSRRRFSGLEGIAGPDALGRLVGLVKHAALVVRLGALVVRPRASALRLAALAGRLAALAAGASVLASTAGAASIFEFDRWMQQVERRALSLQKGLDRGDNATAVADAREIERLYRNMETYFTLSGDAASAVELSRKGWQDAVDIAARSATNDVDGARVLIKTLMEDCRTCHREYKPLT